MPALQPHLEVGSYYGKYFLLKKLAAAGMGEIFLAKQQGPAGFEKILVVKIIDFGIAKSEMRTVKTEAGMMKGNFGYMSPEQSLAKKLDKRSDIFAIGITLYEMITGTNPFHKSTIVLTLEAVQLYDPPPPSEYDAAYAQFDPIIAKALAK